MAKVERLTPDLSEYPDLVVIYLGMQVRAWYGIKTLLGFGPKISNAVGEQPDGLLLHENIVWSLFPPHAGMRQYWRDFDSLERWARSAPHRDWWRGFVRDSGGTGFWHETYLAGRDGGGVRRHRQATGHGEVRRDASRRGADVLGAERARLPEGAGVPAAAVSEEELS